MLHRLWSVLLTFCTARPETPSWRLSANQMLLVRVRLMALSIAGMSVIAACRGDDSRKSGRSFTATMGSGPVALDVTSLSHAAGGADGDVYMVTDVTAPGIVAGRVVGGAAKDAIVEPNSDTEVCRPYSESLVAGADGGVTGAAVWLVGVSAGPSDDAPRRVSMAISGCRFEPRIARVALGGTVLINHRDAMMSRLQFAVSGDSASKLAEILFSDAGQVVPTSVAASVPGLIAITDTRHRWIKGWLLVSPHPFATVTEADGSFRFDHVPPGKYHLVVWHEYLGVRHLPVTVEANIQTTVEMDFDKHQ